MTVSQETSFGKVIRDGEFATLSFERHLPHSVETVWKAITDPAQLAEWNMTEAKIEGRTGGSIDFISGPYRFHITGKILVWDRRMSSNMNGTSSLKVIFQRARRAS